MYCINCGVQLADTEKSCPLCRMPVKLPEGYAVTGKPLYPQAAIPQQTGKNRGFAVVMTALFFMAAAVTALCDLSGGTVTWCGYAIGGLIVAYVGLILPAWFRRPNPVIFVPCFFGAVALFLLYIDLVVTGGWFLCFAFPVTGCVCLLVTAAVTLLRYVGKGKLYIFGGGLMGFGGLFLLLEFLLTGTFPAVSFIGWSVYPLAAFTLLGGFLIFLGISPAARETMRRKFFF